MGKLITVRKVVIFSQACVKNSVHREGVCIPACTGTDTPQADTPPGRHPLGQTPPWADTPWSDTPSADTPLNRHPLWADTSRQTPPGPVHAGIHTHTRPVHAGIWPPPPLPSAYCDTNPPAQCMLGYTPSTLPPPPRRPLQRTVRIILERNLV